MTKEEKRIYLIGILAVIPLLCMILSVLFPEQAAAETEPKTQDSGILETDFAEKLQNKTINGQIIASNTSNTSNTLNALNQEKPTTNQEINQESESADESETEKETETGGIVEADEGFRIYRIAGELPDPELQREIWDALSAAGICYWYEGALAQCYQESHFQRFAVNQRNGIDSGLFQYRSTFWDWSQGDIFDVDVQIRKYAAEMAARFNAGLTADEAISRHKTSDYCTEIDWSYVEQVRQWLGQMEVVE